MSAFSFSQTPYFERAFVIRAALFIPEHHAKKSPPPPASLDNLESTYPLND
jgi:hypothetical protein